MRRGESPSSDNICITSVGYPTKTSYVQKNAYFGLNSTPTTTMYHYFRTIRRAPSDIATILNARYYDDRLSWQPLEHPPPRQNLKSTFRESERSRLDLYSNKANHHHNTTRNTKHVNVNKPHKSTVITTSRAAKYCFENE